MGIYLYIIGEASGTFTSSINKTLKDGSKVDLIVQAKKKDNPNDKVSPEGVFLSFYLGKEKIGEVGISAIESEMPFLYDLEVKEKYRGQGYGSIILEYCIAKYKVNDLSVSIDNEKAISLYKKHGFKERFKYKEGKETLSYMQIHKRGYANQ